MKGDYQRIGDVMLKNMRTLKVWKLQAVRSSILVFHINRFLSYTYNINVGTVLFLFLYLLNWLVTKIYVFCLDNS